MTSLHYDDLKMFGGTTVALEPKDKGLCTDKLCKTEIEDHKAHICSGADVR